MKNLEKIEKDSPTEETPEEDQPITVTQRIIGWLWFFFKIGFALSVILFIMIVGAVIGIIKGFSEQVPIITDKSYRPNLTSQVFDNRGRLIAKLHATENRTKILTNAEIPKVMRQAIVAIEDERFYQHYGVDLEGIIRAAVKNFQAGKIVQGASTLTQQLVKNAFLSNEKTLKRKIKEALMAFQLEQKYSKDEILTLYLNEIYFGHGAYGLDAASRVYFNKEAIDLTLLECAILAGIPKSPVVYSPFKYPQNNKMRRELVLNKMLELGFITTAESEKARKDTVKLFNENSEVFYSPYFVTYVRDLLLEKYGANLVYNGGLKIYTSLDSEMQKYAEEAMTGSEILKSRPIEKDPDMNGSLVCIDPHTGHIKAMFGGRDFEKSQFNRVTQALRQPGSSFKPFVYGCALENGFLPGDLILDEPISYTNPWSHKVWSPKNYDLKFHGTVTLMKALQNSFNIPAVKLIDKLTPAKVVRFTRKLGITAQMEPNLSLALGSGNFTPLEMASAYGVFANQGIYVSPMAILKVEDRDGNILEENIPHAREVMKAIHASMLTDMLKLAVERGTGKNAAIKGRAVAGKTGTTNDYIDAWFNGFSPELVTVVQFGYDHPKTLGPKKAGGVVAAPAWKAFMEKALKAYPESNFPVPEDGARIRICIASGKPGSKSCPSNFLTDQVYPIESIAKIQCPIHSGGARYVYEGDDGIEFVGGLTPDTQAQSNFAPDDDFFQADYSNRNVAASNVKIEGTSGEDAYLYAPEYFKRNSNREILAPKPTRQENDNNNPLKNLESSYDFSDVPAHERASSHEPGVVMKPNIEFRDSFQ